MGLYVIVWKPCISLSPPEALLRSPTLHTPPDGSRSEGLLGGPGVGGLPHLLFPELEDTVVAGCGVSRDENPPTWPPIPRRSTSCCRFPPSRAARPTRETFTQRVSTGRGAGPWLHRGRGGVNEGVPRVAQTPPQTASPATTTHTRIPPGPTCHQGPLMPRLHGTRVQATILAQLDLVADTQGASRLLSWTHTACLSLRKLFKCLS